jgi:perosamine synthetase
VERITAFMIKIFKKFLLIILKAFYRPYYGFISGHGYLSSSQLKSVRTLIKENNPEIVSKFERMFSKIVGKGESVSYASARMGFYDLMRILKIGRGDEIILLGSTCSVMANAVLKTGATPIYSDIDPETFGSSPSSIESCISESTKMIVAQHSFGIPCDIVKIKSIARLKKIFLLEDCALSLGSSSNNIVVGNFGDASLFSTDHSKPLNTLTGGMVYTRNKKLANMLRSSRNYCEELSQNKKKSLWIRLLVEKRYCNPKKYGMMSLIDFVYMIGVKFFGLTSPFLSNDSGSITTHNNYPYPAKLPTFLAQLGVYEVERWEFYKNNRRLFFHSMVNLTNKKSLKNFLPKAYSNNSLYIIPLRFVWSEKNGSLRRQEFSKFINVDWTWFINPIVDTSEPLNNFNYSSNSCPISEAKGKNIVNVPCNINTNQHKDLLLKLKLSL